ncbi:MAG: hypothetical protein KGZ25_09810 [Planctomycetes bacterium]|nr:hypothetical protein [Planctomycetota bacterium]
MAQALQPVDRVVRPGAVCYFSDCGGLPPLCRCATTNDRTPEGAHYEPDVDFAACNKSRTVQYNREVLVVDRFSGPRRREKDKASDRRQTIQVLKGLKQRHTSKNWSAF